MKFQKGLSFLALTLIHAIFLLESEFVDSTVTSKLFLLLFSYFFQFFISRQPNERCTLSDRFR
jgi:hypothetical protein